MADAPPPGPGRRAGLWELFVYTANRDQLLIPAIVAAELVATGLTATMVVLWHPLFIVIGFLLALVAPLVALNLRLRQLYRDEAEDLPPDRSADLP